MNRQDRSSRSRRGGRSLWQTLARLPRWAADLFTSWRGDPTIYNSGRELRLIRNALLDLIRVVDDRIAAVEAEEWTWEANSQP